MTACKALWRGSTGGGGAGVGGDGGGEGGGDGGGAATSKFLLVQRMVVPSYNMPLASITGLTLQA